MLRLFFAVSLVTGCTVETDVPVRILVGDGVAAVDYLDVFTLVDGCPDSPLTLVDGGTRFSETMSFTIPSDATAVAAFAIRDCGRVAYGCAELVGSSEITVSVEPLDAPQNLCSSDERCGGDGTCELRVDPPGCEMSLFDPERDEDGDGLSNGAECGGQSECFSVEACGEFDEDGDGDPDFLDPLTPPSGDMDSDGIPDLFECCDDDGSCPRLERCFDTDQDGTPDYLDEDSDEDGVPDAEECAVSECLADRDGDGFIDVRDMDADGDGLIDGQDRDRGTGEGERECIDDEPRSCGSCGGCSQSCNDRLEQCIPSVDVYEVRFSGELASTSMLLLDAFTIDSEPEFVEIEALTLESEGLMLVADIASTSLPPELSSSFYENALGFEQCVAGVCLAVVNFGAQSAGRLFTDSPVGGGSLLLVLSNLKIDLETSSRLFGRLWSLGLVEPQPLDRGWNQLGDFESVVMLR